MTGIVVVGSANLDIVVPVERHPTVGETVLGGDHELIPGGKGANQAVAAARLGASVSMVGRTGEDAAAEILRQSIEGAGVDTRNLVADADAPSGLALITVGPDGDNAIVVSPGANGRVSESDITDARDLLAAADVVLAQLEIPLDAVLAAAAATTGLFVLDPAPAPAGLPGSLLEQTDIVVPNEIELAALLGINALPEEVDAIAEAARQLPTREVVVTIGRRGAVLVGPDGWSHVAAPEVDAVDTTGAGDAFRAALARAIAGGSSRIEAVEWAARVGAVATLRFGAQPAMPTADEVESMLAAP